MCYLNKEPHAGTTEAGWCRSSCSGITFGCLTYHLWLFWAPFPSMFKCRCFVPALLEISGCFQIPVVQPLLQRSLAVPSCWLCLTYSTRPSLSLSEKGGAVNKLTNKDGTHPQLQANRQGCRLVRSVAVAGEGLPPLLEGLSKWQNFPRPGKLEACSF